MYPEHFLPYGSVLPVFHSTASTPTNYFSARDQRLRKTPSPDSPPLPTFRDITERSRTIEHVNVFLVILNAEIKFQRYLDRISHNPPATPLPADVLDLMHLTVELVHLLYWKPVPTKGSPGETVFARKMSESQSKLGRKRRFLNYPANMDFEARRAYATALMAGHGVLLSLSSSHIQSTEYVYLDYDYDPALFEGATPIDDN